MLTFEDSRWNSCRPSSMVLDAEEEAAYYLFVLRVKLAGSLSLLYIVLDRSLNIDLNGSLLCVILCGCTGLCRRQHCIVRGKRNNPALEILIQHPHGTEQV